MIKYSGQHLPIDTILTAMLLDNLSIFRWANPSPASHSLPWLPVRYPRNQTRYPL